MRILSQTTIPNPDANLVVIEASVSADEEINLSERYAPIFFDIPDNATSFVLIEAEGENSIMPVDAPQATVSGSPTSLLAWSWNTRSLPNLMRGFRIRFATNVKITFGYFRRGINWLQNNWGCQSCKIAVRTAINMALTAAGIPSPDLYDVVQVLPDDFANIILENLDKLLGQGNPVSEAIRWLLNNWTLPLPGLSRLSDLICQRLGICPPNPRP